MQIKRITDISVNTYLSSRWLRQLFHILICMVYLFSSYSIQGQTIDIRISSSSDDAEEQSSGTVGLSSSDLELVQENSTQEIGMRFNNISIPNGAIITSAWIQFQVDEVTSVSTTLTIKGEQIANAITFTTSSNNISNRTTTNASVSWSPVAWNTVGEQGIDQRTSDLQSIIQEIVDQSGWISDNSLAIIITGTGERVAESFDGISAAAPLLHVAYSTGGSTDCNFIENPEFIDGTTSWNLWVDTGNTATMSIDNTSILSGTNSLYIDISAASGTDSQIELSQSSLSITNGVEYAVSFDAKAFASKDIYSSILLTNAPYTEYWGESITLTNTATSYGPFIFTALATENSNLGLYFGFGDDTNDVWIDNIVFEENGCTIIPLVSYEMDDANGQTINTCSGNFYDAGGAANNYQNYEDYDVTFCADNGENIIIDFITFNIENQDNCNYDYIRIYDGPTSSSILLGEYCGSDSPGLVTSSNGCLHIVFHSDESITNIGWEAEISCTIPCGDGITTDYYGSSCDGTENVAIDITDSGDINETTIEVVYNACDAGSTIDVNSSIGTISLPKTNTSAQGAYVYRTTVSGYVTNISHNSVCGSCSDTNGLQSMMAFVVRSTISPKTYQTVYSENGGSCNIESFDIPILTEYNVRDVNIVVPLTEITDDGTYLTVRATDNSGVATISETIYGSNPSLGTCCFNMVAMTITNVPASSTFISIEIITDGANNPSGDGSCGQSWILAGSILVEVNCCATIDNPGMISGNQTICTGDVPTIINNEAIAISSGGEAISYQWFKSTSSCEKPTGLNPEWELIIGATNTSFDPGNITASTCYVRAVQEASCDSYNGFSNVVSIGFDVGCLECVDALNQNGDLENEGTATNFDLVLSNTPALLIEASYLPLWWGDRYDPNVINTSIFQGPYYLNKSGTSGDPHSGSHFAFLKGNGICLSALEINTPLDCGTTYRFSAWVAAYTPFGQQSESPFKIEFFASGDASDYDGNDSFTAPASASWNTLNWHQYSFDIVVPGNDYTTADFVFTSLNDNHGIVIDDVCIKEINKGSEALAGLDQFNCINGFTMDANTPEVGYNGSWSVVSGTADITSINSPITEVSITTNSIATLRWTVSDGTCSSFDELVIAYEDISAISVNSDTICSGASTVLTVSGCSGSVVWSNGETTNSITVSPTSTNSYTVSCTPTLPSNSILNSDFESATNFEYWDDWANASITTNASDVNSGTKAAKADATTAWAGFGQDVSVIEGAFFELNFWAKTDDITLDAEFGYTYYDSGWNEISSYYENITSNTYTEYTISAVTPPNTAYINIGGGTSSPNSLYVDDVSLLVGIGCTKSTTSTVMVNVLPIVDAGMGQIICPGESTILLASGSSGIAPYTYEWNEGLGSGITHTVNPILTTNYEVSITDAIGCMSTDVVTITVECSATITAADVCEGADIVVDFDGLPGYDTDRIEIYEEGDTIALDWLYTNGTQSSANGTGGVSGSISFNGFQIDQYDVKLFVDNSNIVVATDDVFVNGNPTVSLSDVSICPGESETLIPDVCESYHDIKAQRPLENIGWSNQYDVGGSGLIGDGKLCFNFSDAVGTTYNMIGLNADPLTDASYFSIDYAMYFVTSSNNTVRIYESGVYKGEIYNSAISYIDSVFCVRRIGNTVAYLMNDIVLYTSLITTNNTLYYDNSIYSTGTTYSEINNIELCGEVGLSYEWSNGSTTPTIDVNTAGTYHVTITNGKGCSATDQSVAIMNPGPIVSISSGVTICPGESVIISGNGSNGLEPYTYNWDQGLGTGQNHTVNPIITTNYTLTITDANGCTDVDIVTITINCNATISAAGVCEGEDIMVSFTDMPGHNTDWIGIYPQGGGAILDWNFTNGSKLTSNGTGGTNGTIVFNGFSNGDYEVKLFADSSNVILDTDLFSLSENPIAYAGLDVSICPGDTTTLLASASGGIPGYTYLWDNGLGSGAEKMVNPNITTTYIVTATDSNGCIDSNAIIVTVKELPSGGTIGDDENGCGTFDPALIISITDPTGTDCGVPVGSGQDCCDNGEKPIAFFMQYNGESCDDSDNNQGPVGDKWDCSGDAEGDTEVYISANNGQFSGLISMNETFSASNGGSNLTNPIVFSVYNEEGGTLLQTIEIHTSCSVPIVTGDQFGSLILLAAEYTDMDQCGTTETGMTYQWQEKIENGDWLDIDDAVALTYDPVIISETTQYRRVATNCCGFDISNIVTKTVNSVVFGFAGVDESICTNSSTTLTASQGLVAYQYGFVIKEEPEPNPATTDNVLKFIATVGGSGPRLLVYTDGNTTPTTLLLNKIVRIESNNQDHTHSDIKVGFKSNDGYTRSFLDFDISSISGIIDSSFLVLMPDAAGNIHVGVYPVSEDWEATQANWLYSMANTLWETPGGINVGTPLLDSLHITAKQDYAWNVTDLVDAWVNGNDDGSGAYSYDWSNGSNTKSITISPAVNTTYTVTITDLNTGCSDTDQVLVEVTTDNLDPGVIDVDISSCGAFDPALLTSNQDATGACGSVTTDDCCNNGDKPISFLMKYNGGSCDDSVNNQGPIGDKWDCTGDAGGDPEVYISVNSGQFAGVVNMNETFTVSNGGSDLTNPIVISVYDENGGTLLQTIEIHTSCSVPIVMEDQFGSLILKTASYPGGETCIGVSNDIDYQWQTYNTISSLWEDISGEIVNNYDPGYISETTKYRRLAFNCCGFKTSNEVTLTVHDVPILEASSDDVICAGDTTTISATATGGFGIYTYIWNGFGNGQTQWVSPATTTTYTVTVTDGNGCTDIDQMTVVVNPLPSADAGIDQTICYGSTTLLTANANGGSGSGYTYEWSNGANTDTTTVGDLVTTDYIVTVTDGNGCKDTNRITITIDNEFDPGTLSGNESYCGSFDPTNISGTIPTGCSGGTPQYQWQNRLSGGIWSDISGAIAIDYDPITITETYEYRRQVRPFGGGNWTISDTIIKTVWSFPTADAGNDETICYGSSILMTATASGGSGIGYTYIWSNGANTDATTLSPLVNTSYIVTVTDSNGCTDTNLVKIIIDEQFDPGTITGDESICGSYDPANISGTIPSECNGGTPEYQWQSRLPAGTWSDIIGATAKDYNPVNIVETHEYRRQIRPNGGGIWTISNIVSKIVWNIPIADAGPDLIICYGLTTLLTTTASGGSEMGYTYVWSNGATTDTTTVSPIENTIYIVTVTDSNGCSDTNQVEIIVDDQFSPGIVSGNEAHCGAYDPTIIIGTTAMGCEGADPHYVWLDRVSGGNWNTIGGAADESYDPDVITETTEYQRKVRPKGGGTWTYSNTITKSVWGFPSVDVGSDTTICANTNTLLLAIATDGSGIGYTYAWSNGSNNDSNYVAPLVTTDYIVTVTDSNGCTDIDQITVNVNDLPDASVINDGPILCSDGTVTMTASPAGMIYAWSGGGTEQTKDVTIPGNYTVTVTNSNGCSKSVMTTVLIDTIAPGGSISNDGPLTCTKTTVDISADSPTVGVDYLWSDGGETTPIKSVVIPGTYTVTITNPINGCTTILSSIVNQDTIAPNGSISNSGPLNCADTTILITASSATPGVSYLWSHGGDTTATKIVNSPDTYSVTITDLTNGCTTVKSNIVNQDIIAPNGSISNDGILTCVNTSVTITAASITPGVKYLWSHGGDTTLTKTVSNPGNYTVTITDQNNSCTTILSSTVLEDIGLPDANAGPDIMICKGSILTLTATGGVSYVWSHGLGNSASVLVSPIINTIYSVTVTESNGCIAIDEVEVSLSPDMSVIIDISGDVCLEDDTQLSALVTGGTANYSYNWTGPNGFVSSLQTIDVNENGNYYVTVTDAIGCITNTTAYVYEQYDPFIVTLNTTICEGEEVTLTVQSGAAVSYQWGANAGSLTTESVTVTPGLPSTSYTVTVTNNLGCSAIATAVIGVIAKPEVNITGPMSICIGQTSNLTPIIGGTWISTNNAVATVSNSGIVTAVGIGSASFIFTDSNTGCNSDSTTSITIIPNTPVVITGTADICMGDTTEYTADVAGGIWMSSNTSIATVDNNGLITSISPGVATITNIPIAAMCYESNSKDIEIIANPVIALIGPGTICEGETTSLVPSTGGTWTSSDTSIAIVSSEGVVTGVGDGDAFISFLLSSTGCLTVTDPPITVIGTPQLSLIGPDQICVGELTSLSPTTGGVWSSSNPSIASISSSGVVLGFSVGTVEMSFLEIINGCTTDEVITITINEIPTVNLTGPDELCVGEISTIAPSIDGSWTSSDSTVASITNNGTITALSAGVVKFTYTNALTGCISEESNPLIVHNRPLVYFDGPSEICVGDISNLLPATGGSWASLNDTIATITSNGLITGIAEGTANFVYTNSATGCESDSSISIVVFPIPIIEVTGPTDICVDDLTQLSPTSGGIWTSSNNYIATVNNEGVVFGVAAGYVNFVFTAYGSNCSSIESDSILINPKPTITMDGPTSLCVGSTTIVLASTTGVWTSSNENVATITSAGLITGLESGISFITFTDDEGCSSMLSTPISVFMIPVVEITGQDTICIQTTTTLTPSSGGSWTSTDNNIATVSANGIVTGLNVGSARFVFTETGSNCPSEESAPITILTIPTIEITGPLALCIGETSSLISSNEAGTWMSNNESVATISNDGIVTALSQGLARFTYVNENGCASILSSPIAVYSKPTVLIIGSDVLCIDDSRTLFPSSGGSWISSDTLIATVDNSGIINAIGAGTVHFIYTDDITGCSSNATDDVVVNSKPEVNIIGGTDICVGSQTQLVPTTGGIWNSSDLSIAFVDNTGLVTGLSGGSAVFTFTDISTGCKSDGITGVTIVAPPSPGDLGQPEICIGEQTIILGVVDGTWSSSNDAIATVDSNGLITGINQGTVNFILIDNTSGCVSEESASLIVHGNPNIWKGNSNDLCAGNTMNIFPAVGGSWMSLNPSIATVGTDGLVTGVSNGLASFVFMDDDTGCSTDSDNMTITVISGAAVSIVGESDICLEYTTQLSPSSGGIWVSSDERIATVTNGGIVTGHAPGKVTFQFLDSDSGCSAGSVTDIVTITSCLNSDFNVALIDMQISGDLSTNDNTPIGTTYDDFNTIVFSKPVSSSPSLEINSDGSYIFIGQKAGKYIFYVPVCVPPTVSGCPQSILEITVIDDIYADLNPVSNLEFATTFEGDTITDIGQLVTLNSVSNDRCVNTLGCDINSSLLEVLNSSDKGMITNDNIGNINYTPNAGFVGLDTILYKNCVDGDPNNCSISQQIITVNAISANNSTVAADDFIYTNIGTSVNGNAILNDSDPEGDNISITPQGTELSPIAITSGSYYINSVGNFEFTPSSNFTGNTEIIYTLCDDNANSVCTNATIHILVLPYLELNIKVYIEGALMNNQDEFSSTSGRPLMRDNLRVSPYTGLNTIKRRDPYSVFTGIVDITPMYQHVGSGSLTSNKYISDSVTVFNRIGDNAIVDWVFVELRSKEDMTIPIVTRSGLLQRDGDIVDLDGLSPLAFSGVAVDSFYVVVKHRLHLAVMSTLVSNKQEIDFTSLDFPVFNYGTTMFEGVDFTGLSQNDNVKSGYRALWGGDFDSDGKVKFSSPNDDLNYLFFEVVLYENQIYNTNFDFAYGYHQGDYNMDSKVKFDNPNDDKNLLYAQVLFYPLNNEGFLANFNYFIEQVPPAQY